ncbi:hypothetical protein [Nocardiopsis lambiniae]|uniref:Uncharacterized protein n=1 Tax=Nocardiopsis lambiniae TaxID=3075539 RepID=A0ABU2MF62_9ACTN|nr:hypothetical protein [Nocardiopsis sp. DSM 44743]MDT0330881.1 hypothetical protein [Nocardiopsis sp. DSM 44743]
MNTLTAPTALEHLDALLRQDCIRPLPDVDGDDLAFLHIDCVSISATGERYTLEHFDDEGNCLRTIQCSHEQIFEVADLVRAYRDQPHAHGREKARPCLRLVKGQQR